MSVTALKIKKVLKFNNTYSPRKSYTNTFRENNSIEEKHGIVTGYKQGVTGCGSQRSQCSCYLTKTHINSVILILKLDLTSMRNIYIKSGLC